MTGNKANRTRITGGAWAHIPRKMRSATVEKMCESMNQPVSPHSLVAEGRMFCQRIRG